MAIDRPICLYEQYHCCPSHTDCRLYHICSQLPKKPFVPNSNRYRFKRSQPLDNTERLEHQKLYDFYNSLWGDRKQKAREYNKKNQKYRTERQRQYRAKKNPPKEFSSVLFDGVCDRNCEFCIYDDCILPTWENQKEYDALYYQKNREARIQRSREWYLSHKDERKEYDREYKKKHKEEISARKKEYAEKNRERIKAQRRQYYEEHKEEISARKKEYIEKNRERIKAQRHQYYEKHKEEILVKQRQYNAIKREGKNK